MGYYGSRPIRVFIVSPMSNNILNQYRVIVIITTIVYGLHEINLLPKKSLGIKENHHVDKPCNFNNINDVIYDVKLKMLG